MTPRKTPDALKANGGDPACPDHGMMISDDGHTWKCSTKGCRVKWKPEK